MSLRLIRIGKSEKFIFNILTFILNPHSHKLTKANDSMCVCKFVFMHARTPAQG